jgi:hypothetical protein
MRCPYSKPRDGFSNAAGDVHGLFVDNRRGMYSPSFSQPALNTSSETRYGRIVSFLDSLLSAQNRQERAYIPGADIGFIPVDVAMK